MIVSSMLATARYRPPLTAIASSATRLSVPWTLALTMTARPIPRISCSVLKDSSGASGGV